MLRNKSIHFYLVLCLFAVYLVNGLIAIPRNSVTYDEMDHWSYGKRILMRKTDKVFPFDDASAMPISGVNAIPRAVQQLRNPELLKTDGGFSDIMNGRYVTLIVCLLTGLFIYLWSKKLFGEKGGLLSLGLFVFCPNLNGHGTLLTTDAYTALITVSTGFYYWKFIKQSGWRNFIAFCFSLGIAQIVKYSMIHLVILFAIISLLVLIKRKTFFSGLKRNFGRLAVLAVIVLFIINCGFLFNKTGSNLKDFNAASQSFKSLQSSFIGDIPLPLPRPYVEGLDLTNYMNELGPGDVNVSDKAYLLGEKRTGTGFWYYYLVVFAFKTPLTSLLLLAGAIIFLFARKEKQGHPSSMIFLLAFIFYFLIVLGMQNNVQIGIRHALMVFPLLYVLAGFVVSLSWFQKKEKPFFALLMIYAATTFYFYFPNLISYSNELITDKKSAYKIIADSNLDFGQSWEYLQVYFRKYPEVKIIPKTPEKGKFAIGINDYLGLTNKNEYSWASSLKPVGHINHCYLVLENK